MRDDYQIHLNFLPVNGPIPEFVVYRKAVVSQQEDRPFEGATYHRLPSGGQNEEHWPSYWISLEAVEGFERYQAGPDLNRELTRHVLYGALTKSVALALHPNQVLPPRNAFIDEVSFVMAHHAEGDEMLIAQPYYLRADQKLGFLVDFHFHKADGVAFSRKVQQLSLSLDRNFRRNLDYCADRANRIHRFVKERWAVFSNLRTPGTDQPIVLDQGFCSRPADLLHRRVYLFSNGKESRSQFMGLKEHGPLKPLDGPPKLLFAFREQDRHAARLLAMSLKGSAKGQTFPGFKTLFRADLEIDGNPIILADLSEASMRLALERALRDKPASPRLLPVIVLPDGDDNGYLAQKSLFSHSEIPTQVCTTRILQDNDSLKWAVGNLALQLFCKAGGMPWKVRPTPEKSLIIGISQSHKLRLVEDRTQVEKYFAFSVLTDNSGLFQKLQVLGESENQQHYLTNLKATLRNELRQNAQSFERVVIHTSFKLKHLEIDAIKSVVNEVAAAGGNNCKFSVIKVNHKSRFFGINRHVNSLVPYEGTMVSLGNHEYLVWFEGIFPDKPTVSKAFPGPTHLQFLRVNEESMTWAEERDLIQDLMNLSGANWRGFNAKAAPVSVFYCHLVAELVREFYEQNLPLPAVQDIRPWFLLITQMSTRSKDIIFLLGAGVSVESNVPMSAQMIREVEALLKEHDDWKPFLDLYNHVKSGIFFSAGLKGLFNWDVPFNIETLVNALYELERNEEHPLYPFIASWNSRFVALAGHNFCNIRLLRRRILAVLKRWMCPADPSLADYYGGLKTLQRDLNYPLRVFSLNYDMCVERLNAPDFRVETGFEGHGTRFAWSFQRFEEIEDGAKTPAEIYLYKLHGSINWMRDPATKNLFSHEQIESVDAERLEVIFGRDFKLEAADPYLFYAYEFRKYTLSAKLIVSVGYGFMNSHINKMITQGLRTDSSHQVLVVQNFKEQKDADEAVKGIVQRLELTETQGKRVLGFVPGGAKTFLLKEDLPAYLNGLVLPTERRSLLNALEDSLCQRR